MKLRHFEFSGPVICPNPQGSWHRNWHGLEEKTEALSHERRLAIYDSDVKTREQGLLTEGEFERDGLLSILQSYGGKHFTFTELGAGYGSISLSLGGAIVNRLVENVPLSFSCLAMEAESLHYGWLQENFKRNFRSCAAEAICGAISDKNGSCRFDSLGDSSNRYGQSIMPTRLPVPPVSSVQKFILGRMDRKKALGVFYKALFKSSVTVPAFTIDKVLGDYHMSHVNLIHIDVQGYEYKAILGAKDSISKAKIDYLWIGIHSCELGRLLKSALLDKFDLLVDIEHHSVGHVEGFPPIKCEDGIQLYRARRLK